MCTRLSQRLPQLLSSRAHQDRASIGESLKAVVLGRRAAICIQRCWRWNLVKRRMELLTGALNLTRAIRSPVLYIEERLFLGLNTISAVDRYPRFRESQLAFGFSVASEAPVLLRNQARGKAQQPYCQEERSGLPQWFLQETQLAVHDAELKLRPVRGLQGLLLEGLGSEERTIEVSSPFLETFARTCAAGGMDKELEEVGVTQAALAASGGTLRYLELRFPTVLQARQRALLLYLCTFNFDKHAAVPVFVRHQLYDADATYGVLRLWDLYGLDWPRASKAGIFLLRARDPKPSEVILANGSKVRGAAELRAEWQSAEEDQRRASLAQVHAERELQRLERLNKKKRNADVEEIMQQLSTVPPQELLEALQSGKLPSSVDSQLVEAWILGNRLNFSGRVVDKKQLAKRAASEKLAMRKLLAAAKEQGATRDFGDRGAEDRELARQWEARLMEFYARANDDRVAEEARCLVEARRANGEGPDRWLVDVEASERHRSPLEVDSEYDHAQSMRGSSAPHVYEQLEQSQGLLPEDPGKTAAVEESPSMEGLENVRAGEGPAKNDVCGGWYVSKKASKAARQELRQMAATFSSRRCFLQRVHKVADVRQIKAAREDQNRARLHDYRTAWAARTQILATKHGSMLDHQRRDLDDLRSHLGNLSELQKQQTSEDLQSKREAILEQKVTKRLRAQLHGSPSPWGGMTIGMPSFPEEAFAMRFPCKLAKTFQSGTESTRASNLGSTLQDLRLSHADATDATWTEAKGTQQMASTMQSLPSQAQGELARPMAATDGWHQVRPPPPRQLPLRPPRPSPKERGGFWVKQGALSARTKGSHS
ncbi:unnamed protein product [Symbiodinium pilosum]|uniref:Uncharacterized protein n=1 Tax=Symbiodinium pilosum TaxID=2952 RepID=A0A812X3T0_SYMPI|nr:unnamed protein product [Symbiodinium pilosum]